MTIWVRNLGVPDVASNGGSPLLIYIRELLRLARWSEVSNNGDAGWPDVGGVVNNLVAQPNDLQVNPANPRRIYSPSGPFTSAMVGYVISLLAVNDQNRSAWKIAKYIDANNIEVDDQGFTPWNWVAEVGITGRVTRCTTALTAPTATCLWNAPTGGMQARLLYSSTSAQICYVRPKGNAAIPLATECTGITFNNQSAWKHRMHMVAEDENLLIWWSTEDIGFEIIMWGKLIDADALDIEPNFIYGKSAAATGGPPTTTAPYTYEMWMLDGADADIRAYPTVPKPWWDGSSVTPFFNYFHARLMNGRPGYAPVRSMWVMLDNVLTNGACVRGRIPLVGQSYIGYERLRPVDAIGDWLHLYYGLIVPRNGPNDQLPLVPAA